MSFKKYRFIDLLVFLVLYLIIEYLVETSAIKWFPEQIFSVSLLLPMSILVMVRWEWYAIVNVIIYSCGYVLFSSRPGTLNQYIIYLLGALGLILTIFALNKKKSAKIVAKWYYSLFYVIAAYIVMNVFRGIGAMILTDVGIEIIWQYFWIDLLNLAFAILVILIARKANGLLMNQKSYLLALEKEKEEANKKALEESELEQD